MDKSKKLILWFDEVNNKDVGLVGGKNASLGEMYRKLSKKKVNIPYGFAITAEAYRHFITSAKIEQKIKVALAGLNTHNIHNLMTKGKKVRSIILNAKFPVELDEAITKAYDRLCKKYGKNTDVAVRSSATAEDLPSITKDSQVLVKVNNKPVYDTIENIYSQYAESNNKIEVLAMNNNEVEWHNAEMYAHPAKNKKLYKIITETGREITITQNHSLIILDSNKLEPKTTHISELNGGEMVPVTRFVPDLGINLNEINVYDYVKGKDVYGENELIYIKNNSSNWKIQKPLKSKLKIDNNLAYFLGIYCAEGNTIKITA